MILPLLLAVALSADPEPGSAPAQPVAPPPQEIAAGVTLIPGGILPGRGPDGNTIIFDAPQGLIVVDTGRHVWQSDAIVAFAQARGRPVAAIVNTHWHLDHNSGNRRVKAVFPNAPVYTTSAIDRALTPQGFLGLNNNTAQLQAMLDDPNTPELTKEEIRLGMETMSLGETLRPEIVLSRSQRMRIAGRRLDVRITDGAVTDADVWLYDRRTRVAVIGDLVTFPAPFFESACPDAWKRALDAVWATNFTTVIPGHGAPMDRAQFDGYRGAFSGFVDCARTEAEPAECVNIWMERAAQFYTTDEERAEGRGYTNYYVGFLRRNNGTGQTCLTR